MNYEYLSKPKPLQQPLLGCHPPLPRQHGRQALSLPQRHRSGSLDAAAALHIFGPIFLIQVASDNSSIATFTAMPARWHSPKDWIIAVRNTEDGNSQLLQELRFHRVPAEASSFFLVELCLPSHKKHKTSKPLEISVYCPRRPQCGAKSWSPAGTKCQFRGCQKKLTN